MSFASFLFKNMCHRNDTKRDKNLIPPENVTACKNIPYGNGGKYNLLDVYYPEDTEKPLPVIVSIHGGGYVYGTKEVYFHYCMYLASLGFTVVNFNYHLAPGKKFPYQLGEINQVMCWIGENAENFYMDINNVFVVGDSAGAQLNSQYAAIYSNPEYAKLFDFTVPSNIKIRALALNCGLYSIETKASAGGVLDVSALQQDYLGKICDDKLKARLEILSNITSEFPPSFIMTSEYDFLKDNAEPMAKLLSEKGVENVCKKYGNEGQTYMAHVFHVNMNLEEARICNQEEADFFRKYIR